MSEKQVLRACEELIKGVLPADWNFTVGNAPQSRSGQFDSWFKLTSPEQQSVSYVVEVKRSPTAKSIVDAVTQLKLLLEGRKGALPLLAAGYLSRRSQEVLKELDVSYVDATGNMRLTASSPGLFVEVQGAQKDPWPDDQPLRTLRGRGAGRSVRALVDTIPALRRPRTQRPNWCRCGDVIPSHRSLGTRRNRHERQSRWRDARRLGWRAASLESGLRTS